MDFFRVYKIKALEWGKKSLDSPLNDLSKRRPVASTLPFVSSKSFSEVKRRGFVSLRLLNTWTQLMSS